MNTDWIGPTVFVLLIGVVLFGVFHSVLKHLDQRDTDDLLVTVGLSLLAIMIWSAMLSSAVNFRMHTP